MIADVARRVLPASRVSGCATSIGLELDSDSMARREEWWPVRASGTLAIHSQGEMDDLAVWGILHIDYLLANI